MNISWNDLNNVGEAGDYPFRDGTITVTFAEIAIWKKNPGAQFQLMRKYPIQSVFRYVLGRQLQEKSAAADSEFIYESSNGDKWCLARDPVTGARAVRHTPNLQSGGQTTYIEVEKFLSESANGPEHHALRRLLEARRQPATILIALDIHHPTGDAYDELIKAIQSLGTWWHHLETIWIVQCDQELIQIRDILNSHIGSEDQLLVLDISRDKAEWAGINDTGSEWLKNNI